ncbi:RagB/SusD family nutrient uptake outer membrane protein [Sphingobacterium sp. SRCM116780]|uniref:RagB/SusD family nutrient uptake outer membrane protein n=1 Tax=Sphingobacterium sp. SRCM116780 TaxID=2907623 RepID=UPI001F3795A0|nr:RagB/SusD family nutrient uptake outer membrane protein [Sphingobacterium sp. SRCM116780]UIR54984.1 RagB/SusD family nutrient uptake outer membrane protein [Sphingobacterium sp. SRCM116780]
MKKIILYSLGMLTLTGCSKWLDKEPIGILTEEQVQGDPTEGTVMTGINNAYRPLAYTLNIFGNWDWNGGLVVRPDFILEDFASGDANKKWSPDGDQAWMDDVANFNFTAENGAFAGIWKYDYEGIARCNMAIFQLTDPAILKKLNFNEEKRMQLLGESSFLRAFFYFDLVKYFGDVPMVLKPLSSFNEAYEVAVRVPKKDVYEQIKTDLQVAITGIPTTKYSHTTDKWRVSKGAAIALMAKVALFNEDWQGVINQVGALDQLGFYSLNTRYFDAFDESKAYNENENIFIYDHQNGQQPLHGNGLTALMGWGFYAPSTNFLSEFETNDPRKELTVNVTDQAIYKLLGAQNTVFKGNDDSPVNKIFIRYSDVLLWKAEALIRTNQLSAGVTIINQIRQRARAGQAGVLPDRNVNTTDANQAMQWLQHERRVELGLECHRMSDLRRWNIAKQTLNALGKPYADKHNLYPIPQAEVDKTAGKIVQNTGY